LAVVGIEILLPQPLGRRVQRERPGRRVRAAVPISVNHWASMPFPTGIFHYGALASLIIITGCTGKDATPSVDGSLGAESGYVPIVLEGGNAERRLRFYVGSISGAEAKDPVSAGLLINRDGQWLLQDPRRIGGMPSSHLQTLFDQSVESGFLGLDDLEDYVQEHYYAAREFPATLDAWQERRGSWSEPDWFKLEVQGSMVPQRRITWVRRADVEAALDGMTSLTDSIVYRQGTVFIGEHVGNGGIDETTIMYKRGDGLWDFLAYDGEGNLTELIRKEPRDMLIPTRCTGCHYGDRMFEPERSFPAMASPGPSGERSIFVPTAWRQPSIARQMQEHARRSDTVLGLYATLYLAEAVSGDSPHPAKARAYMHKFGLDSLQP